MSRKLELAGQRFGTWTVLMEDGRTGAGSILWACSCDCGNQGRVAGSLLRAGKSTSCGCAVAKPRIEDGYVILVKHGHPNAKSGGRIREHRYVMSEMIGRPLLPGESVHHKNGKRDDNRPENLELWVTLQPTGQRPEDLVLFAHEILNRYEGLKVAA